MDLDEQRLRDCYQAGVLSETPASREHCPAPEMTLRLLRSRLSGRKAARVIDHISHCGSCAGELQFLLKAVRQENLLIRDAERAFAVRPPKQSGEPDSRDSKALFRRLGLYARRLSWGPVSLFGGLTVISLAVAGFLVFRSSESYRSEEGNGLKLHKPVDRVVSRFPLVFKWESVKEAESYTFELFDRALSPVWKTDELGASEFVLPEEAVDKLAAESMYFWMVTARLPDGESRASRLEKFTFRE